MKSQLVYLILLIVLAKSQEPTTEEFEQFQKEAQQRVKEFNEQARLRQEEMETAQAENSKFSNAFQNGRTEFKGSNRLMADEQNAETQVKYVEIRGKYSQETPFPTDKKYQNNGSNMMDQVPPHMMYGEQVLEEKIEKIEMIENVQRIQMIEMIEKTEKIETEQNNKNNKRNSRPHRLFQEQGWTICNPDADIQLKQRLMVLGMDAISKKYNPIKNGSDFNGIGEMEEQKIDQVNHFKIPYYFINTNDESVEYQVILTEKLEIIGCEIQPQP